MQIVIQLTITARQ